MWHFQNLAYGGHHNGERTTTKLLSGLWWLRLFKDCKSYVHECLERQKTCNISKRDEMPLKGIIKVELFDCRGINFMGHFPLYNSIIYIIIHIDYVNKWVEAIYYVPNNAQTVSNYLINNVFARLEVPSFLK